MAYQDLHLSFRGNEDDARGAFTPALSAKGCARATERYQRECVKNGARALERSAGLSYNCLPEDSGYRASRGYNLPGFTRAV
jgi:hypothetical protein